MTRPIQDIHPKDIEQNEISELLKQFSDIVSETVNHGTHILKWEVTEATGSDENIPIAMMLRHILELTDAVSILVEKSSIDPCKTLLRSILETLLQLEYILESNTKERALSFLVWHYHKEIMLAKKLTPTDPSYTQLVQKIQADKSTTSGITPPVINNLADHIDNLEKILQLPLYATSEAEYQRLIAAGSKVKNWYQLFGNINNFEQLANHLNRQALYEVLYRGWSGPTHGTDIIQSKLSKSANGQGEIVQIRFVKDAQMVTHYAVTLGLMAYQIMVDKRIVKHKIENAQWYLTISKAYLQLAGQPLIKMT